MGMVAPKRHVKLKDVIHTAEFRVFDTIEENIISRRERTEPPLQHIHSFLDIHQSTLHHYYQAATASRSAAAAAQPSLWRYGPNSALKIEGEEHVISLISQKQGGQDCSSLRAVCKFAAALLAKEHNVPLTDGEHLSRDWWHHFRKRHKDVIAAVKIAVTVARPHGLSRDCV